MPLDIQEAVQRWPGLKKSIETGIESNDGREEELLEFILQQPNYSQFNSSPELLLAAIDDFSAQKHFMISVGTHKSQVLSELLTKEKPKVVLELGGYLGYSAILFASSLKKVHQSEKSFHIWSVELEEKFAGIAGKLIDIAGLSSYITIVVGPAEEVVRRLHNQGDLTKIDWLFLDHSEKLYLPHFQEVRSLGLLKEGSTIVADNVVRPGAPAYRAFVRGDPFLDSVGVRGLIEPGHLEDELEVTHVKAVDS